jgi:hypothetical protein
MENTLSQNVNVKQIQDALFWLATFKTIPAIDIRTLHYEGPVHCKTREARDLFCKALGSTIGTAEERLKSIAYTAHYKLAGHSAEGHGQVVIDFLQDTNYIDLYFDSPQGTAIFEIVDLGGFIHPQYAMAIAVAIYKFLDSDFPHLAAIQEFFQSRNTLLESALQLKGINNLSDREI